MVVEYLWNVENVKNIWHATSSCHYICTCFSDLALFVALKISKLTSITTVTTVNGVIEANGGNGAHD